MTQEPNIFPYIERLLQGEEVVWKPLGEVAEIKTGQTVSKNIIAENTGIYPVINSGREPLGFINTWNTDNDPIGITSRGAGVGSVTWQEGKYFRGNLNYSVSIHDSSILDTRFLYHLLLQMQIDIQALCTFQGIPALNAANLKKLSIPLPPLSVQQEIVRILDKFTQLEAELEAELDCRKRQYEYYRNKLLTFNELENGGGVEIVWKTLGEVAIKIYSGGTPKTGESEYWEKGMIPWMSSGEVNLGTIYQTEKFITEEGLANSSAKFVPVDSLVIALAGQGKTRGKVARIKIKLTTNQSLAALTFESNKVCSDYVYHYMVTQYEKLRQISSGSGTRGGLNLQMISNFPIPLPPLSEQQRIASILDKFDTLVNSISEGLPKEIALRRKQYEYYRERLLSFPKQ